GEAAVVLPSATGGTHAGLLTAMALAAPPRPVVGSAVAGTAADLRPTILGRLDGPAPLAGAVVDPAALILEDDQLGDGYGRRTAAADEATGLLARTEGILVDPIYTAK